MFLILDYNIECMIATWMLYVSAPRHFPEGCARPASFFGKKYFDTKVSWITQARVALLYL
jgi:hypothetical protein